MNLLNSTRYIDQGQITLHKPLYAFNNLMLTVHTRDTVISILTCIEIPVVQYTLDLRSMVFPSRRSDKSSLGYQAN